MALRDINQLHDAIERITKCQQSAEIEREKSRMEFQLRILRAEREQVVAKRALLLFDAFWKNGRMTVTRPGGGRLEYDGGPHHVSDIQKVWNARGQADTLANWSEP